VLHLALALLFLVGLPQVLFQTSLSSRVFLWLPDYGYTLLVGGLLALGWGILRTVLAYVALRNMRFDPWVNARVSLAGPVVGGVAAAACLAAAVTLDSDLLRALAYAGFMLNLINLVPVAFLDGAHVLRSWRVLRAGGGRTNAADARRLAAVVAIATFATVAGLVLGMIAAHVPQDRL